MVDYFFIFVDKIKKQKPMKVTKIHDLLPFKRVDFGPKIILGKLKKLMFWGQGPWTVDIEIAQKWSIGTPLQKLKIFQI